MQTLPAEVEGDVFSSEWDGQGHMLDDEMAGAEGLGAAEVSLGDVSDTGLRDANLAGGEERNELDGKDEDDRDEPPDPSITLPATTKAASTTAAALTDTESKTHTTTSSTLRNRHHRDRPTSGADILASPRAGRDTQDTEKDLASHRQGQETLTASLVTLATQLKTSTQNFHTTLESEKSVLDRAVDGLDRTTMSMASAERRMGMLRRMTEGKGWWGRMLLYAWIFVLWFVSLAIVFLGPKLR